jgi:hypothetical protein
MKDLYQFLSLIAGTASIEFVTSKLRAFLQLELPSSTVDILNYYIECAESGGYPSKEYLQQFSLYDPPSQPILSEAELSVYLNSISKSLERHSLRTRVINAINSDDLEKELQGVLEDTQSVVSYDYTNSISEDSDVVRSDINMGVFEVDDITHNFVGGTVATIAAFTSHGKSTACVSAVYRAMKNNKKCCYFSLELPPSVVIKQFFTRWLFEEHNVVCTFSDLLQGTMDSATATRVNSLKFEFNAWVRDRLIIVDESLLTKSFISDFRQIKSVYADIADKLGGVLHLVVYDHVGQIELMHPDRGNQTLRNITSAGKTYINPDGSMPVTLWACQVNREGYSRAIRRQGKYDLLAIADLNEVERSSSYVIFLFKENEAVVQELKITMPKHRYGALIPEPVPVSFNPAVYTLGSDFAQSSGAGAFSSVFDSAMNSFELPSLDGLAPGQGSEGFKFKF